MLITPLTFATFTGELAKWDNFSCVVHDIQEFLTNPREIIKSRFDAKTQRIPIRKIINVETKLKFNSAQELADKLGCKRSSVYTKVCSGAALGYVNVATKEFVTLGVKRASVTDKIKLMERGFIPAHFIKKD